MTRKGDPLLSMVTTVHTESRLQFLRTLLNSISKQVWRDFETIVIVEGSGNLFERTKKAVSEINGVNASVSFVPNRVGASACRNIGARQSSGKIVCFVDDDVILDSGLASRIASAFKSGRVVALVGAAVPFWQDPEDSWFPTSLQWILSCTEWYGGKVRETTNMWTMNSAIDKQVFAKVGGFDDKLGPRKGRKAGYSNLAEDLEFSLRLRKAGYKAYFVPWISCRHRVQHSQVSFRYIVRRSVWIGFEWKSLRTRNEPRESRSPVLVSLLRDLAGLRC